MFKLFITLIFSLALGVANLSQYTPSKKVAKYFNQEECSLILNKYYYLNCYDFEYKGSKAVAYILKKENLTGSYIKERPPFRSDNEIPEAYRTHTSDYTHSGYDRGHILSNASMRSTKEAQESTFLLSNITPQKPEVNRRVWKDIEEREREVAIQEETLEVLNIIVYGDNPKYIKNNIAIPLGYIKILYSKPEECYYVPNIQIKDLEYKHYQIDCKQVP